MEVFFFFCPYTEKYDENNRHCFIFPNLFGSLSLELMRREGKGRVAGPSAISIGRHSTISEWLLPNRNIVGSYGPPAKGNTSVSGASSFCHLFLLYSAAHEDNRSSRSRCISLEAGITSTAEFSVITRGFLGGGNKHVKKICELCCKLPEGNKTRGRKKIRRRRLDSKLTFVYRAY